MDKLKDMFSKDKKTSNLILIVILLVIVLVFMNYIFNSDTENTKAVDVLSKSVNTVDTIETKLANIISKIEGVESASVLVSYSSTEKIIPVYDTKENTDSVKEDNKISTKTTIEKNVAYEGSSALLESKQNATATGAIVVVKGSLEANTITEIKEAVSYTTGVPLHKIQIFIN